MDVLVQAERLYAGFSNNYYGELSGVAAQGRILISYRWGLEAGYPWSLADTKCPCKSLSYANEGVAVCSWTCWPF